MILSLIIGGMATGWSLAGAHYGPAILIFLATLIRGWIIVGDIKELEDKQKQRKKVRQLYS